MELIRLTPENASKFIGYEILFKTRGKHIIKKILGVTRTSIKIDHPDLQNCLQMGRKIFILIN